MSSEAERAIAINSSTAPQETSEPTPEANPIDIYRPQASPLPGNRPIADNTTDDIDDMLGYLD